MPDCSLLPSATATAAAATSDIRAPSWHASLRLRFADDGGVTRLTERAHSGPLRVQKALYPEGPRICHAIVVHPPGGVVGGDHLEIDAVLGPAAHALLTSPGAAKWYRANGRQSRQRVRIEVGAGAMCESMPQEAIFFNGADVRLGQQIVLAADARYIGCEILCLGRRACGERFASGRIAQHIEIRRAGQLLWWEQGVLDAAGAMPDSPLGLAGHSVCATLIGVGAPLPPALIARMRALDPALGVSQVKAVFVARFLGHDSERARHLMFSLWQLLRPHLLGCAAPLPRIWNT